VKWDSVRFRIRSGQINKEGDNLAATENKPVGNESPEMSGLGIHDAAKAKRARENKHTDQRQSQCDLIADHLRAGPESAKKRILAVRGPSRQSHTIHAERSHAEHGEQADIHIGNLNRRTDLSDV